jgi:alpha-glucosidase
MYRRALALRHELQGEEKLAWISLELPDVLAFQRPTGWTVVTNFGDSPVALPDGLRELEVVLASADLDDAAPGVVPPATTLWLR